MEIGQSTSEFNECFFHLEIKTTNSYQTKGLMNRFEHPDSELISIKLSPLMYYSEEDDDLLPKCESYLNEKGFIGSSLTLKFMSTEDRRTYTNDKNYFTVRELLDIILKFSYEDRKASKWFGGIDTNSINFEGIEYLKEYGCHKIIWGS